MFRLCFHETGERVVSFAEPPEARYLFALAEAGRYRVSR